MDPPINAKEILTKIINAIKQKKIKKICSIKILNYNLQTI